jgi:hypothetical protein
MTFGFVNGTNVKGSANMTLCQSIIDVEWIQNGYYLVNNTLDWQIFPAITNLLDITYNVDTISKVCFSGYYNAYLGLVGLVGIYWTPKYLFENIIYNFGEIYSDIRDFY